MDKKVNKKIQIQLSNNKKIQLPIIESTIGPDVIDVRSLYKETGTMDKAEKEQTVEKLKKLIKYIGEEIVVDLSDTNV